MPPQNRSLGGHLVLSPGPARGMHSFPLEDGASQVQRMVRPRTVLGAFRACPLEAGAHNASQDCSSCIPCVPARGWFVPGPHDGASQDRSKCIRACPLEGGAPQVQTMVRPRTVPGAFVRVIT